MSEWNPNLYLKFEKERTQPVKDLISRIEKDNPTRIIDIGCGPGNSTRELKKRWGNAHIIGLDSSQNMIKKAKVDYPDLEWIVCDASGDLTSLGSFDIVFSNAAIQWMPDHKGLLEKLFGMLNNNGVLAIQVPNPTYMPISVAVHKTAAEERWQIYFKNLDNGLQYEDLCYYYDVLSSLAKEIYLWETHYNHILSSHEAIIEWYSSTGMKPYLEKLSDREKEEFTKSVLLKIIKEYIIQNDGNVLFQFRRLFFIAYR
jgi:trans-aconitate 2-methyltransferase